MTSALTETQKAALKEALRDRENNLNNALFVRNPGDALLVEMVKAEKATLAEIRKILLTA